jgi:hypothetical protein
MSYHTSAIVVGGKYSAWVDAHFNNFCQWQFTNLVVNSISLGGIGGLAAASAALRHFDQVTLVDKDDRAPKIAGETNPQARSVVLHICFVLLRQLRGSSHSRVFEILCFCYSALLYPTSYLSIP